MWKSGTQDRERGKPGMWKIRNSGMRESGKLEMTELATGPLSGRVIEAAICSHARLAQDSSNQFMKMRCASSWRHADSI